MPRSRSRSRSPSRQRRSKDGKHKKHKKEKRRRRRRSTSSPSSSSPSRSRSRSPASARLLVKAAKKFLKDKLKGGGGGGGGKQPVFPAPEDPLLPQGAPQPPTLSAADYFSRAREFACWLNDARGQAASDLGPGEGRALFEGPFCAAWNSLSLPARFYDGSLAAAPALRTAHDWGIAKGTGPAVPSAAEEAAAWAEARDGKAAARAAEAGKARARLEEVAPRADPGSHEARQAARAGRALAAREASPDGPPTAALMGGGDSFEAARERERQASAWRDRRDAERNAGLNAKAAAAKEAEEARMAAFRALVASGPIVIPKRAPAPE